MNPGAKLTPEILVTRLGDALMERGLISPQDLDRALDRQQKMRSAGESPSLLGQILIQMGLIDSQTLDEVITEQIIQLRTALQDANSQLERRVKERTAELQEALRKLSELSQMKSNFVANISHELRTPLTHLKGYLALLEAGDLGGLSEDQSRALKVMLTASDRLERLIEDLILFSMSERGQIALSVEPFDLHAVCKIAFAAIQAKGSAQGRRFELVCPLGLPLVTGDRDKILWVITQLLDNAFKFTPQSGTIRLEVTEETEFARICVQDTGIGIPPNKIDQVFEPFHQLDEGLNRRYSGVGLGLALAAHIVTAHGSVIRVTSEESIGSQFAFLLPFAEPSGGDKP